MSQVKQGMVRFPTRKSHYGWKAESSMNIGGDYVLSVTTMKRSSGRLTTIATVGKKDGQFISHTMFQDFNKQIASSAPARVTAKVVDSQHDSIDEDALIADAKKFYNLD